MPTNPSTPSVSTNPPGITAWKTTEVILYFVLYTLMIGSSVVATGIVQYSKIASMSLTVFSSVMGVVLPMTVAFFNAQNKKQLKKLKSYHKKICKDIQQCQSKLKVENHSVNHVALEPSGQVVDENSRLLTSSPNEELSLENAIKLTNIDYAELEAWSGTSILIYGSVMVLSVACNSLSAGLSGLPNMDIAISVLNMVATISGYLSATLASYFSSIHHSNINRADLITKELKKLQNKSQ